jgi:hypothetical protein
MKEFLGAPFAKMGFHTAYKCSAKHFDQTFLKFVSAAGKGEID